MTRVGRTLSLVAVVATFMLGELILSRRHEAVLRRQGAVEPAGDVYRWMSFAYPASFLAMAAESLWRGMPRAPWWSVGLVVFALGKALKVSAIRALGPRWSFRVLVLPGVPLVTRGPYRMMRHPNYVGVAGELLGCAIAMQAPIAGMSALGLFAWLLAARIRVEEQALGLSAARGASREDRIAPPDV